MGSIFLDTELGNEALVTLKSNNWKQIKEYSCLAFDKGIDFDSYLLKKGKLSLEFEWTNWFEWEVTGSKNALKKLAQECSLKLEIN